MAGRRRRSRVRTRGRGAFRSRTRSNSSNNATTSPNGDSNTTGGRRGVQVRRRGPGRVASAGRAVKTGFNNTTDRFESSQSMPQSRSSSTSAEAGAGPSNSGSDSGYGSMNRRASTPGDGGGSGPNPGPGGYGSQDNICPICRTQITSLCITNCNHRFCRDCIRRWTSRHATCPTCRANIHTIRNILPNGGTEIIQISRAELVAHKVNEIHAILMLLFTVMSHTLLPEVSNFLEQLNQIARELSVPTTNTRLENARTAAAQAANAGRSPRASTNSPTTSTTSGSSDSNNGSVRGRSSSMGSGSFGLALLRRPENSGLSRSRSRSVGRFSERASSDSDDEASDTDATAGSSSGNNSASVSPSDSAALVRMTRLGSIMSGGLRFATNLSGPSRTSASLAPPLLGVKSLMPTAKTTKGAAASGYGSGVSNGGFHSPSRGGKSLSAPDAASSASTTKSAATQTSLLLARSRAPERSLSTSRSTSFDSARDNPRIRYTYQQPGATGAAAGAAAKSTLAPISFSEHQGPTTRSASTATLKSAAASGGSNQANQQSRPPTEEEARRNLEQRQRDIRFLTDSYNKINQVYEVLMIMHLVIHRNQVEVDTPAEEPEV